MLAGAGIAGTAGAAHADGKATVADCATAWGSLTKSSSAPGTTPLRNIRTGANTCYDRIVFDIDGATAERGYHVGYVDKFQQDGSGEEIPVNGGAILQIFVHAPSYDPYTGKPTYGGKGGQSLPGVDLTGYKTFKDTKFGASFEGQTQVGVGVRAKLPFRVSQTTDKLIVDVAHTW
ncbi:hypothetical protein ACFQ2B_12755 [Streptomyces stramineus]|uniref:AMIN-like domain-containing protein n=1 Tax=Streptomyces stramineus TaxID=173861 RepID=A0ABP3KVW7_9ACTN